MKMRNFIILSMAIVFSVNTFAQKVDIGDGYALLICDNGDM